MKPVPTVGITITTRDRKADLMRTLAVVAALRPAADEVIICADGCSDGTAESCRALYPDYSLIVHEISRGSVTSRNEMIGMATSDVVFSLDDDSHPIETDAIERLRRLFLENERLGVAMFPQRSDEFPESLTAVDFGPRKFVGIFNNSGAAIRRSVFMELGGYPARFHHCYEEPDFALRCAEAGWQVRFDLSMTIRHHYTSVSRSEQRTHHFNSRNELWSVFMRCPMPQLFAVAPFRLLRQFGYACGRGPRWIVREPLWWLDFLKGLPACLAERKPIPWNRYRAWMELARSPILSEEEWQKKFGPT